MQCCHSSILKHCLGRRGEDALRFTVFRTVCYVGSLSQKRKRIGCVFGALLGKSGDED